MDRSAYASLILLLVSFFIRDLFMSYGPPETETQGDRKVEKGFDLDEDAVVSKRDTFFDDDDDDNFNKFKGPDGSDLSSPFGPGSRISSAKFSGPTVRFLYCTTSGYKNAYDQFLSIIQEKHPELFVEGSTYPPENSKRIGAQVVNAVKFLIIGSLFLSQYRLLNAIGVPVRLTTWMSDNRIYACLVCFFLCNFAESQLIATGAFEIYFDDVPIWSKLQTGRVPSPPELMQIIDNQLKMGGRDSGMDGFLSPK